MKRILGVIAVVLALAAVPAAAQRGNWITTVVPSPGALSTVSEPPTWLTRWRMAVNP